MAYFEVNKSASAVSNYWENQSEEIFSGNWCTKSGQTKSLSGIHSQIFTLHENCTFIQFNMCYFH